MSDAPWYKDAIIYELHVRSFYDSNGDGMGDFKGLTERLDYLADLGVNAIWLLPFYPSPWRDDGYDGSGTAYNLTATLGGLTRLAARLPDRHVVLLDDVPSGSEMHVRTHLRRDFRTLRPIQGMTRAEADAQREIYVPNFRRLAAEIPNVSSHSVFTGLCDAAHCPLLAGSELLFRDGDHLSHAGALSLTDAARGLLQATP